ncbi:MAG: prephenate dehydrogenase [Thermoleophilaceae bacterium]|nr:prephenate dehydrogenase [Thermoleophilaceae bacterium]
MALRLGILGVGLIGGSIGLAARAGGAEVAGFDPDSAVLDAALERGAIDRPAASVADAVREADAVFACATVGALPALVDEALAAAAPGTVVTDVGSTKRAIAAHVTDERFVGGHPIAGSESAGVQHARADLFQGAAWYLTPSTRSSGVLYERLHGLLVSFGARPLALDAESHDRLLATVSHLPHVLANVLVSQAARTVDREDEPLPRVGPSFRDATRVAGANSGIWTDIYMQNAAAIADEVDATIQRLGDISTALRRCDADAVRAWNDRARDDRRRLLEADIAGGPVHELRVTVDNRPGVVAELAVALGRGGVNIVDMRLAPAPDNLTGAITFWIAGDESAQRAAQLIEGLGFPVMEQG